MHEKFLRNRYFSLKKNLLFFSYILPQELRSSLKKTFQTFCVGFSNSGHIA